MRAKRLNKQNGDNVSGFSSVEMRAKVLDQKNDFTETPLHVCLRKDNFDCLQLLIRNNASISVKDKYGNTVVHTAALRNKVDGLKEMMSVFEDDEGRMQEWQDVLKIENKKNLVPAALATEIPVVEASKL